MTKEILQTGMFVSEAEQWAKRSVLNFDDLINAVRDIHQRSSHAAVKAINRYATMRNWLMGFFIVEYEQKGNDRAKYGEKLLKRLEDSLQTRGLNVTLFQNCRLFYACYPQVADLFLLTIQPTSSVKNDDNAREIQPTASVKLLCFAVTR